MQKCVCAQACLTLWYPVDSPPGSSVCGIFQATILVVDWHFLLQGVFLTQGSNLHLLESPALASGFFTTSATWDVEDVGSIPGLGRFPGGGDGNPFQYSCLGNPMDSGAWRGHRVHGEVSMQSSP